MRYDLIAHLPSCNGWFQYVTFATHTLAIKEPHDSWAVRYPLQWSSGSKVSCPLGLWLWFRLLIFVFRMRLNPSETQNLLCQASAGKGPDTKYVPGSLVRFRSHVSPKSKVKLSFTKSPIQFYWKFLRNKAQTLDRFTFKYELEIHKTWTSRIRWASITRDLLVGIISWK